MQVPLPDGSQLALDGGPTGAGAARATGPGPAQAALPFRHPGELRAPSAAGAEGRPPHCGPHGPSTKRVKAFKLTSVAGAYWRGDEKREMLTRIYGTAFMSQEDLAAHLKRLEEARARDHRKLGRELDLFMFSELSPGSPFWQPAGMAIWNELTTLWRDENARRGYREVRTPILYDIELWKQSGHWDTYRDNMYVTEVEERQMGLKPMNCPAHIQIYKSDRRSYRDPPTRPPEA